jgi:hypothetical protein
MKKQRRTSGFSWNRQKTLIMMVSIAFVAAWGRFYIFIADHYDHQMAIALTALLVASIAAIGTLLSLKWTRDTIRPFLYMHGSMNVKKAGKYIKLEFNVINSGSLPAEEVCVDIDFFDEYEEITEENTSSKYAPPIRELEFPTLFPDSTYREDYILNLKQKNDLALWSKIIKGKVNLRTKIKYESLGRKHVTIMTEKLEKRAWEETIVTTPIPPQKWT